MSFQYMLLQHDSCNVYICEKNKTKLCIAGTARNILARSSLNFTSMGFKNLLSKNRTNLIKLFHIIQLKCVRNFIALIKDISGNGL